MDHLGSHLALGPTPSRCRRRQQPVRCAAGRPRGYIAWRRSASAATATLEVAVSVSVLPEGNCQLARELDRSLLCYDFGKRRHKPEHRKAMVAGSFSAHVAKACMCLVRFVSRAKVGHPRSQCCLAKRMGTCTTQTCPSSHLPLPRGSSAPWRTWSRPTRGCSFS